MGVSEVPDIPGPEGPSKAVGLSLLLLAGLARASQAAGHPAQLGHSQ